MSKYFIFAVIILGIALVINLVARRSINYNGVMDAGMTITSGAFVDRGQIPAKYTCDGEGVNPPLTISGVPVGTKSLSLIVDDPDAPGGTWTHWVLWNIKPDTANISKNSVPVGAVVGINSWPKNEYGGPCPPAGSHRYFFKLYALDTELTIPITGNAGELMNTMAGHILTQTELVGNYSRKK